ncbi:MAG: uroporphyrinogen-III synthase, partial [Candidatus Krumholzibacteriia bacterium]
MSEPPRGPGDPALPLRGRRVIVTRAADQADDLAPALAGLGAEVIACPVLRAELLTATHLAPLRDRLADYAWIVFTSANGVRGLLSQLAGLELDARALGAAKIACVGAATAAALAAAGLHADFVPADFRAEAMLREFLAAHDVAGARLLRVRGGRAATGVEDALREAGAEVDALDTYRTVPTEPPIDVRADILARGADAVTFASGSAVDGFDRAVPE